MRGLAFEYRAKRDDATLAARLGPGASSSARSCRRCCGASRSPTSCAASRSTPTCEYVGGFFNLLNPYALLGGVTTLLLFLDPRRDVHLPQDRRPDPARARAASPLRVGVGAAVVAVAFLVWTQVETGTVASAVAFALAAVALRGRALRRAPGGREGWGFLGTFVAIALGVAGLFLALFPDVMPTTLADGVSLTTTNAAATHYTLKIMTGGRGDLHAGRAGLPGLDLLGLPQADRGAPHPRTPTPAAAGR